jgi:uncharacterized protein YdcH (DUF465 family)
MASENKILETILEEFPHLNERITELFDVSSSFIEICEDYVLCLNYIKKAESMKEMVGDDELFELRSAFFELKEELLSKI